MKKNQRRIIAIHPMPRNAMDFSANLAYACPMATPLPTLIAFDLDGTLLDTESLGVPDLIQCLNEDFGVPVTMEIWLQHFHGTSGPAMINKLNAMFATDLTFEAFYPVRHARLEKLYAAGVGAAPGVLQVVRTLHTQGQKICICTNSTQTRLKMLLEKTRGQHSAGINLAETFARHSFSAVGDVGNTTPSRSKPAPDVYLAAAAHYKIEAPSTALAIEDSVTGVQAAVAAGFTCWGYTGLNPHPKEEAEKLKKAGAQKILPHWDDFFPLLAKFKPKPPRK